MAAYTTQALDVTSCQGTSILCKKAKRSTITSRTEGKAAVQLCRLNKIQCIRSPFISSSSLLIPSTPCQLLNLLRKRSQSTCKKTTSPRNAETCFPLFLVKRVGSTLFFTCTKAFGSPPGTSSASSLLEPTSKLETRTSSSSPAQNQAQLG